MKQLDVIKNPSKDAARYIKPQTINVGGTYRLMRYVLQSGNRFYHLVTGEVIQLEAESLSAVEGLPAAYAPWMDELIRHYYLVEREYDEKDWVDFLRAAGRVMFETASVPHYIIMPTTCCNARCAYCFQQDMKRETMTDETVEETVDYIAKTSTGRKVSITWYGGEPLAGSAVIDKICSKLKKRGILWEAFIITNGYLAESAMVEKMAEQWLVNRAQITLDGTEADYNRIKAYTPAPADSPFQRVLKHIEGLLAAGIAVVIRMNLGKENGESLLQLARECCSRFKNSGKLSFAVAILSGLETTSEERKSLHRMCNRIRREIQDHGFYAGNALSSLRMYGCMGDRNESAVILPDGSTGKCFRYPQKNSGKLSDGVWPAVYNTVHREAHCAACVLYPDCLQLQLCYKRCYPETADGRIARMRWEMDRL